MTSALKLDVSSRALGAALLALVVALSGAAWFVAIGPKRSHASQLEATIQQKQSAIATAQHQQSESTGGAAAQLGTVQAAMPDALAMPQVVDELNALAVRAGVTLDTITPAAMVAGAGYASVPLTVVVDGRYFAVEQFLHLVRTQVQLQKAKLQASGRLFDVQSVSLDQTEPAPMVTATLTMSAFYYSGTTPAPATATTDSSSSSTTDTTSTTTTPAS